MFRQRIDALSQLDRRLPNRKLLKPLVSHMSFSNLKSQILDCLRKFAPRGKRIRFSYTVDPSDAAILRRELH